MPSWFYIEQMVHQFFKSSKALGDFHETLTNELSSHTLIWGGGQTPSLETVSPSVPPFGHRPKLMYVSLVNLSITDPLRGRLIWSQ